MHRSVHILLSTLIATIVVGGPLGYAHFRQRHFRNFHAVREGVLYRSGQLSLPGLKSVIHDYGIKTIITLRDPSSSNDPPPILAEEEYCLAEAINYYRIMPKPWGGPDGAVPAAESIGIFRNIMDDPKNYPVLIHCLAGIHRTGAYCAVYRMEYEGWSNEQAIAEMRACGYRDLDDEWDLLGYLETYRPRWRLTKPD